MSFNAGLSGSPSLAIDGITGPNATSPVVFPYGFTGGGAIPFSAADANLTMVVATHGSLVAMTPTAARTVTLPSTNVTTGFPVTVINRSASFSITVNASGGTQVTTCGPSTSVTVYATSAAPTLNSQWSIANGGAIQQGGNSIGSALTFGTNDAFGVNIVAGGAAFLTGATNGTVVVGPSGFTGTHTINGNMSIAGSAGTALTVSKSNNAPLIKVVGTTSNSFHLGMQSAGGPFNLYADDASTSLVAVSQVGAVTLGPATGSTGSIVLNDGTNGNFIFNSSVFTGFQNLNVATAGMAISAKTNGTATNGGGGRVEMARIEMYQTTTATNGGIMNFWTQNTSGTLVKSGVIDSGGVWTIGNQTSATVPHVILSATSTANGRALIIQKLASVAQTEFIRLLDATFDGTIRANAGRTALEFGLTSDRRMKQDIEDIEPSLAKILALRPRKFSMRHSPDHSGVGWIAQEFNEVFPFAVGKTDDGTSEELPEGIEPWNLGESHMFPFVVKAIQELHAKIEAQAAEITALKGTNP